MAKGHDLERGRRDFLKVAGLSSLLLLPRCVRDVVDEEWVGNQLEIKTESGLWARVSDSELSSRFESIEESKPLWGDGGMKIVNGELVAVFSTSQLANISKGMVDGQVILRLHYPDSNMFILGKDQVSAQSGIETNIFSEYLSDLLEQVDGFKYDVDLLVDTVIDVAPEVLASTGVVGARRLEAVFKNSQVEGMSVILVNTPHKTLQQDEGKDGYYVRITNRQLDQSVYYKLTVSA
jgi:hypothetical protein